MPRFCTTAQDQRVLVSSNSPKSQKPRLLLPSSSSTCTVGALSVRRRLHTIFDNTRLIRARRRSLQRPLAHVHPWRSQGWPDDANCCRRCHVITYGCLAALSSSLSRVSLLESHSPLTPHVYVYVSCRTCVPGMLSPITHTALLSCRSTYRPLLVSYTLKM